MEDDLNEIIDMIEKLKDDISELEEHYADSIKDVDKFKDRLKLNNLWTYELENFIDEYMTYYNE